MTVIDEQIGRVLELLRQTGALDRTVVVYTADHGDFAAEHGLMLKNLGIYDSIHRVPLLLRYPQGPRGVARDGLVELVDLFPTFCELAGLAIPAGVEGQSLLGVASGERPGKEQVYCEWDFTSHPEQRRVAAIADRRYRMVVYDDVPDDGELYDHQSDPTEQVNRWSDPRLAEVRSRLTAALVEHRGPRRRVWGLEQDRSALAATADLPTARVHRRGERWSSVRP